MLTRNFLKETLNFWKQNSHIMKYWRTEEDENARLPKNFMSGFLEVCLDATSLCVNNLTQYLGTELEVMVPTTVHS